MTIVLPSKVSNEGSNDWGKREAAINGSRRILMQS
jgi:hypothetical protein